MATLFFILALIFLFLFISKNKKLQELESKVKSVDDYCSQKQNEMEDRFNNIKNDVDEYNAKQEKNIQRLSDQKENLENQIAELKSELKAYQQEALLTATDTFIPDQFKSEEYKNQLSVCKLNQKECIKDDTAIKEVYGTANAPSTKKAKNDNRKQILRCFNAECESIFTQITVSNANTKRNAIQKAYESINKIFEIDGFNISQKYYELKLEEFNLYYNYQRQLAVEKDFQKAAKEQMLEEQKVLREIEQEKKKIEKEEKQFNNEINKLMQYMQKANDIEKQLYVDKIKELEEKLKLVEKDKENVMEREQNTRAGYVYIISNIGSFGENIYKIGMTRRLEPMDRVKELGDASVPFKFDVHAMIFSDDAPALEAILHKHFHNKQVNKVNTRKEFFNVTIDEIEKVVKENHNATVNFIKIPEAEEYYQSIELAKQQAQK